MTVAGSPASASKIQPGLYSVLLHPPPKVKLKRINFGISSESGNYCYRRKEWGSYVWLGTKISNRVTNFKMKLYNIKPYIGFEYSRGKWRPASTLMENLGLWKLMWSWHCRQHHPIWWYNFPLLVERDLVLCSPGWWQFPRIFLKHFWIVSLYYIKSSWGDYSRIDSHYYKQIVVSIVIRKGKPWSNMVLYKIQLCSVPIVLFI